MPSPPRRRRPVLVWAVFVWYVFSAGYTLLSFALIFSGRVPLSAEASRYLSSLSPLDYSVTILALLLNVGGAVALLMLRTAAPYLISAALLLNIASVALHAFTKGLVAALGAGGPIGLILSYGISMLVCLYAWRLYARGALTLARR
jgi:hypothetical protein